MNLRAWFLAARPKTLLASISPVAIGATMAHRDGKFHLWSLLAALGGAIAIQIGTNFCNDYFDHFQGADTEQRKGPTRAVASGSISPTAMAWATAFIFGLALLATVYLYQRAGWPFLLIAALSVLFGVMYTAGRYSLAYLGLGDPFVLVFFGPVAVAGTYYVQAGSLDRSIIVAGIAPGLIAVGLLVVNNLRDIDEDRIADKRTLAVRFGATFSRVQYALCIVGAGCVPVVLRAMGSSNGVLLACLFLLFGLVVVARVWKRSGVELRPCLGMTAAALMLYTVLFCVGVSF